MVLIHILNFWQYSFGISKCPSCTSIAFDDCFLCRREQHKGGKECLNSAPITTMLHRTSSRRRTAFRTTGVNSSSSARRGSVPSCSSRGSTSTNVTGRRRNVTVGGLDIRNPTEGSEDWTSSQSRGPRRSIGGDIMPYKNRSPRNSLEPETFRTSPRNSMVPEQNRSSRNSPVPEYDSSPRNSPVDHSPRNAPVKEYDRSPRNSPVPEYDSSPRDSPVPENSRSPRNSLIPEYNHSPRKNPVPEYDRSPRDSPVPEYSRSPRNSLVAEYNRSPRNSLLPDPNRGPRSSLVPDPYRSPRNSLVPDSSRSPRNSLVTDSSRSPRNSLIPESSRGPRRSLVPDSNRSPRSSLVATSTRSQRSSLIPETFERRPKGSLVPDGGGRRSPRGSIVSAVGVVEAAFERAVTFMDTAQPGQCCRMLCSRNGQGLMAHVQNHISVLKISRVKAPYFENFW
jgi:hypothetical protein